MPSVEENRVQWTGYDWKDQGAEWTVGYGSPQVAWDWVIYPRIRAYLPTDHVLELGPGYGLWTQYLLSHARRVTLVDIAENCIAACREKYPGRRNRFHVNDGRSLDMVRDDSVDFVFSWHSLVHAERDVMRAYIGQLGRKLRVGGAGFIHHSNFGVHTEQGTGTPTIPNHHWRGTTMTAAAFREDCNDAGLFCAYQEIVPWGSEENVDAISLFVRDGGPADRETVVESNPRFWDHVREGRRIMTRYARAPTAR